MCRNWKRTAALGMAVLLGCMMPMSTMLAAEDGADTETGSVSDNDAQVVSGGEDLSGNDGAEEIPAQESNQEDAGADDGNPSEDVTADLPQENMVMAASSEKLSGTEPKAEPAGAVTPKIVITRDNVDKACSLGGTVEFEYMNYRGTLFTVSLEQSDGSFSLYYALDTVTDQKAAARNEEQMDSLNWGEITNPPVSIESNSNNDGSYVVYAKAVKKVEGEADQTVYARSSGIVVDTVDPVIKGVEDGGSYPAGTKFQVEDINLKVVKINEQEAAPDGDGNYQVAVNGNSTSCVIKAIDKAGREASCSITVTGSEQPPQDNDVISESGAYELQAGVKYRLAAGKWRVEGDKTVYQGGRDFYVPADGTYRFTK